jgi:hypothetical protein
MMNWFSAAILIIGLLAWCSGKSPSGRHMKNATAHGAEGVTAEI